jgi:hypothetical protein
MELHWIKSVADDSNSIFHPLTANLSNPLERVLQGGGPFSNIHQNIFLLGISFRVASALSPAIVYTHERI